VVVWCARGGGSGGRRDQEKGRPAGKEKRGHATQGSAEIRGEDEKTKKRSGEGAKRGSTTGRRSKRIQEEGKSCPSESAPFSGQRGGHRVLRGRALAARHRT